jgi:AcrR family transcriptional regulator
MISLNSTAEDSSQAPAMHAGAAVPADVVQSPEVAGLSADDPRPSMPPAAAHLLEAAQRVLLTKGFRGLTLRAIAQESGENSAMVQYYFGNKDGLVRALIDSVFRDDQQDAADAMNAAMGDERLPAFVEALRTISSSRSFRVFFDILPYALRNEGLRGRMARVYDWYRLIKCDWLRGKGEPAPPEREALQGVSELMTAVVDGLAIQEAIDDGFDARRAYAVLEFMLQRSLPELVEGGLPEASYQD